MNYLEKLLQGQAVEWVMLGEVTHSIKTGLNPRKFFQLNTSDATNYYVTIRELRNHEIVFSDKTDKINDEALRLCNNRSNLEAGDVLFSGTGTIGVVALITETPKNWNIKEGVYSIKPIQNKLLPKFLLYLFEADFIRSDFLSKSAGGTVKSVPMKEMAKIKIPLPPLSVQQHIAQMLDTMTALTAELTAELTLRQTQYQYYREKLLSFDDETSGGGCKWVMLGEVAQYSKQRIECKDLNEKNYVGVDNLLQDKQGKRLSNYVPTTGKVTKFSNDDILIGNIRPYLKKIWQSDCIGGASGDVLVIQTTSKDLNSRYLYQVLADDNFFAFNMQNAKGSKMPRGDKNAILSYKIPLPPLATQQHIVAMLDTFDTLTQSISEGLPHAISLHQKRYEYYRGELLDFKA